jgi:hypothetical protein
MNGIDGIFYNSWLEATSGIYEKKLGGSISTSEGWRHSFVVVLEVEESGEITPNLFMRNAGHL